MADKEGIRDLADDELEFYTDLVLQESQRWIEVVTRKKFVWLDFCESLRNGVHLCQLLTCIWPGSVENINYNPKGGTENLDAFITTCQELGLEKSQIFDPRDLLDNFIIQGDLLDRETQRRLISITVTVYHIGKLARDSETYFGPQLDLSAFSAIVPYYVKHKDDLFKAPLRRPVDIYQSHSKDTPNFCEQNSEDISHYNHEDHPLPNSRFYDKASTEDFYVKNTYENCRIIKGQQHTEDHFRDSSYGSLGSCDRGQFDEDGPVDMPGKFDPPFSVYSSSNAAAGRDSYLSYDASYGSGEESNFRDSKWKQNSVDLSDAYSDRLHDRYSSTDSMDATGRSSHQHSRQVSTDSMESIPTRVSKRSSFTPVHDPLQFVKVEPSPIAKQVEQTVKTYEEVVKVKEILKEDEEQWQSNLDNWKSRRRRISSKSLQSTEDVESIEKVGGPIRRKSKTFKEIMEEREKRKQEIPYLGLAHANLNPLQSSKVSDDDDNVFEKNTSKKEDSHNKKDAKELDSKALNEIKLSDRSRQLNGDLSDKDSSTNQETLDVHTSDSEQCSSKDLQSQYPDMTDEEDSNEEKSWSRIESEKNQRNESNLPQRYSAYWSSSRSYDSAEHEHNDLDCTKRVKSVPNLQSKEASDQKSDSVSRKSSSMCKSKSSGDIRHDERYHSLEKIITITQRPRSGQTFGFTIKGGKEHKSPIFVDNVIPASSAALCDVKRGDEILSLNGVDMKNNFHTSAMFVIQQAIKTGCVEIKIRRDSVRNLGQSSGARALLAKKNKRDDKSFDEKKKLFESQTGKPNLSDSVSSSLKRDTPSSAISRKKFMFENGSSGDQSQAGQKLEHRRSLDVKKHYQEMLASLDKPVQKTVATREPGSMLDFVTDADREYSSVKPRTSQLKEDFDSLFLKTASLDRHPFNMQKYYAKYATENKTSLDVETIQQKQSLEPLNTSRKDLTSHQKPIDVVYSSDNEASEEEKQYHSLSARRFDYQSDSKKHQDNEEKLPDIVENRPEKSEPLEVEVQRPKEDLRVQTQHEETGELESPTVIFKPEEEELVIYEDDIRPSLAPPTEKPPPPPKLSSSESSRSPSVTEEPIWPCNDTQTNAEKQLSDYASPDPAQGSFLAAKLRRINSTKRIRSEILRRRSDYLMSKDSDSDSNIDNDEIWFSSTNKEIFVDDIDDLESNSNPSLSIDISNRDADDEEEIDRKEREIIENLEMEERQHLKSYNSNDEIDREQLIKYHDEKEKQRHQAFSFETQALMEQYEDQKKRIQEEELQWKEKQTKQLEEFEQEQKRYLEKEAFNAERARRIEEFERDSRNKAEEYKCRQDDLWDRYEFEHQRLQQLHNHEWRKHMEEKARDMNLMQIENYPEHREILVDDPVWKKEDSKEPEWQYHQGTKVDEQDELVKYHHPKETYEPKHQERKLFEDSRGSWNSKEDDTHDESRLQEKRMYAELEEQQKELEHQKLLRERREEEKRLAEEEKRLQDIEQERLEALEEELCRKDEERRLRELRSREELELLKEKEEKLRLQEDLEANSSTSVLECSDNTSAPGSLQVRVVRGAHEPYFFVQRTNQERLRREEERLREESEKLRLEKEEHQRNVQAEKLRAEKEKERAYAYSFAYEPLPGERYDKNFGNYPSVGDHNKRTEWSQPFEEQKKSGSSSHTGVELHKPKSPPRYRPPPLTLTKSIPAPSQVPNLPVRLPPPRVPPKPLSPKPPATPEEMERLELLRLSKQPTPSDEYKKPDIEDNDEFSIQVEPLSKKSMYSLSAVPKAKILGTEQWIEQYERNRKDDGRPRRKPDAPRKGLANVQDHWVVQEAERRRLAEKENKERLQKLQNRNSTHLPTGTLPDEFAIAPQRQKINRHSAHIMEKIDSQATSEPKPYQPIPDSIIQSLTQRLNPNKYSNPVYNPPPQYSQNRVPLPNVMPSHKSAIPPPPPPPPPDQRSSIGSAESQQELLSVSGKKKCSECGEELGRGAAMIIESLNLFYHLQCFKCCVCDTQLGNGSRGADVRVRHNKLHCHNCYSNDEAGLKLSKV